MKKTNTPITRYNAEQGFYVDVVDLPDKFEAWIGHKDYGVKNLMFGWPKFQPVDNSTWTMDMFMELVEGNLDDDKDFFALDQLIADGIMDEDATIDDFREMDFFILDDCTTKAAFCDFDILDARLYYDAIIEAGKRWNALSDHDKARRDSFALCFGRIDEDGIPDSLHGWDIIKEFTA